MLNFDNNNITTSDMNSLFDLFNKNLLVFFVSFSKNAIGNDPALKWLNIKLLNAGNLDLSDARIDTEGAILLANALIKRKHGLWINSINHRRSLLQSQPATNIITLDLSHNLLGDKGVQALCDILPYTRMGRNDIILDNTGITDPKILENCGLLSSDANSLRYELFYPYFLLYSKYRAFQKLFYSALAQFYNSKITLHTEQMAGEHDYSTKQSAHTVDAFSYKASNAVVIDAGSYPDNIVAVRGSVYKNNLLMGGKKTLLDVSESRGSNFLKSENNTKMRLGFFSKDHVVVAEGQGTIQINGFNSNDTLHLIAEHTVYDVEAHLTICQNTILKNGIPSATIQIKETMVQLWNTRCEDIENNIHINDPEAIDRAKWEVMNPPENNQSILYSSLLGMCETFVNSASKSALFTAVPSFVTETLYWTGGYTRNESEKLGQEIQMLLLLSFTESPEIIAASSLASLLASRLTNSQNIISAVGMGVSIASAVAGSLSSVNATLGWMAIQTSTALVGSVVGSWGIYKLPEIGRWGLNKASDTKNYLKNKLSFWSDKTIDSIEVLEVAQNLNMTQMGSK